METITTDWKHLIGKRVRVYLSPDSVYPVSVLVSTYKNGKVTFDGTGTEYDETKLCLYDYGF